MCKQQAQEVLDLDQLIAQNRRAIINILVAIQERYRYLPESVLAELADKLGMPLIEIYSLATFYKLFSLTPRGRHQIVICTGTACHVRGSEKLVDEVSRCLCLERGETTPDGEFSLDTVNCLGACALGPLVIVDQKYHGNMAVSEMNKIIQELK